MIAYTCHCPSGTAGTIHQATCPFADWLPSGAHAPVPVTYHDFSQMTMEEVVKELGPMIDIKYYYGENSKGMAIKQELLSRYAVLERVVEAAQLIAKRNKKGGGAKWIELDKALAACPWPRTRREP